MIIERAADHCGKDKQSHLLKHALISNYPVVDLKHLTSIDKNYHGNKYKRKYQRLYTLNSTGHC